MLFCGHDTAPDDGMSGASRRRIVVAITGATGAIYGVRLLQELRRHGSIETHLVVSKGGAAMPPRVVVAGIVALWLATTGYVVKRDVWPRVFATGPPPVAIELADEAKQNLPARWALVRNGQKIGRLSTSMKYHDATDEFHFTYRYNDLALEQSGLTLVIPHATSEVRTTRGGDLKELGILRRLADAPEARQPRRGEEDAVVVAGRELGEARVHVAADLDGHQVRADRADQRDAPSAFSAAWRLPGIVGRSRSTVKAAQPISRFISKHLRRSAPMISL